MGLLLSIIFGFVPVFIFAYFVYWLDRFEKEPKHLLGSVFLWGAVVAAGSAFMINTLMGAGIYLFTNSETATDLATGLLIAPVVEELLKGIAVLVVFLIVRHEFDSILDGIVYAAIVGWGFAASENAYYIHELGYRQAGLAGLIWLAFVRVVLVGWQHPFYTAFTGIGLAVSRLSKDKFIRVIAPFAGISIAIILHSMHNTLGNVIKGGIGLAANALFDWSGWSLMLLFIIWAIYREQNWIVDHLREEVRVGSISPIQYSTACSPWSQSMARFKSLLEGRYRITNRFYQLCAELAFKKHQRLSYGEENGNSDHIEKMRTELSSLSPSV